MEAPLNKLWCNNYTHTPVVKWCLEEVLGMKSYSLTVNSCVFLDSKGGEFIPPDQVFISQDLDHPADLRAIFHELRHYYQFYNGLYTFAASTYFSPPQPDWDEKRRKLERYLDYLNFPWEMDARAFEQEALRQFWKSPISKDHNPAKSVRR
jgi:hypothetical protein